MPTRTGLLAATLALLAACEQHDETGGDAYADALVEFVPGAGASFGHERLPDIVLGPPGGSLDVATLGCEGEIVLGFDEPIIDGEGPDLVVFENAFAAGFPEPGEVAVSEDGETWQTFACDPVALVGCAGVTPTQPAALEGELEPARTGGDAFDLAALPDAPAQVWYVRIRDRSRAYWAAQGIDYCDPGQMGAGGFDLDAIAALHALI
jgi:hypothetical protein